MKLKIRYADHVEAIEAEPVGERYRLKGHSMFLPLAPDDLVTAENGVISGVVELAPVFMVEAYFSINTPPEHVVAKAKQWRAATYVTQPTALTVLISSQSRDWIEEVVQPEVWWVELIRFPGSEFNFSRAVQEA